MSAIAPANSRATKQNWIALSVLTLPVLLIAIDSTVLNFALPHITKDLQPRADQMLWIIDIYSFMLAGLLVTMGSVGDRIGRKKLLIIGGAGFGLASLLAACATSAFHLIGARALLGIAGATLMPSTLSIIRVMFCDPKQRRTAMGIWSAAFSGGAALGPILGGLLLTKFTWHSVFYLNIPLMMILLILAPFLIPESRTKQPGPLDILSIFLSMGTILPIIYGIKTLAEHPTVLAAIVLNFGLCTGIFFIRRQKKLSYPLLDLHLFKHKTFAAGVFINLISIFALIGGDFILIQHLQLGLGIDTLTAAFLILPGMLAEALAALIAVRIVNFYPTNYVICAGFLLSAVGFILAMTLGAHTPLVIIVIGIVLFCWGTGTSYTLSNDAILSAAPATKAGSAAAVSETAYELGAALGIALLGTIANFTYHVKLTMPAGLTEEQKMKAQATLAEALEVSAHGGHGLAEAARIASASSTIVVGVVVAALMMFSGLYALKTLKKSPH